MSDATPPERTLLVQPTRTWFSISWVKVLIIGFLLWLSTTATAWVTQSTTLIPAVIIIGSFLAPITYIFWLVQREGKTSAIPSALTLEKLIGGFIVAGLIGLLAASLLETLLLKTHPVLFYPGVAIVEEIIKLLLVWVIARNLKYYTVRDGMVLGAVVGFGFAAFESAGYAFNTIIEAQHIDQALRTIIETEIARSTLTPLGHGLWTALLGGALFLAAKNNKLRLTLGVVGWVVLIICLHALWDMSSGIAIMLSDISSGLPVFVGEALEGQVGATSGAREWYDGLYDWVLLSLCAGTGVWLAMHMWHKGRIGVATERR